jgi:hypothetical protein
MEPFELVMRVAHILAAITLAGGTFYQCAVPHRHSANSSQITAAACEMNFAPPGPAWSWSRRSF